MQPVTKKENYNTFLGIDNIGDSTQIIKRPSTTFGGRGTPQVRMLQAENVDIHADSHISRCDGYSLALSGVYTSAWSNDKICLAINAGDLIKVHPDFSTTVLMSGIGNYDVAYETVYDGSAMNVYFTNGNIIGKVKNDVASVLPVTTKEFKSVLPAGNLLRYFQGSLYVVKDKIIYISDVLNKEIYDRRWGFKLFETEILMFESVKDGIYISDSNNVYFMKRVGSTEDIIAAPIFTLIRVYDTPVISGTPCKVYNVTTDKKYEQAIVWVSGNTLCIGGDGGSFETIRDNVYSVNKGRIGTSMFRKSGDLNQYLTIIK